MAMFQACQCVESIVVSMTRCALYVHWRIDGNQDFYWLHILYAIPCLYPTIPFDPQPKM
jgi:hypothetical protein